MTLPEGLTWVRRLRSSLTLSELEVYIEDETGMMGGRLLYHGLPILKDGSLAEMGENPRFEYTFELRGGTDPKRLQASQEYARRSH